MPYDGYEISPEMTADEKRKIRDRLAREMKPPYPHSDDRCRQDSVDAEGFRESSRALARLAEFADLPDTGWTADEIVTKAVRRLANRNRRQDERAARNLAKARQARARRDKAVARAEKAEAELAEANEEIDRLAREVNRLYTEDTEAERKYADLVAAIEPEREEFRRLSAEVKSERERQNPVPDPLKSGGMVSGPELDTQSDDQCQHSEVRTFRTYPPHTKCLACGRVVEQRWVTKGGE